MALEIRSIPVLTGETAERFVRDAEKNERCAKKERLRMSFENVEMILQKSIISPTYRSSRVIIAAKEAFGFKDVL